MKLLLLVPVILIAAAFIGQSVSNTCYAFLPMWHSCVGTTTLDEEAIYTGTWEWNVATGEGTLQRTGGSSYTGDVVAGQANGQGTYTYPDGRQYIGEYKDCQITKTLSARASGRLSWTSTDGAVHHFIAESYALTQRQARAGTMCT